jgi:hypothetical protein
MVVTFVPPIWFNTSAGLTFELAVVCAAAAAVAALFAVVTEVLTAAAV